MKPETNRRPIRQKNKMADTARKTHTARSVSGSPTRKSGLRHRSAPLTVSRPELIVNGSDAEFRELVHNLFGFFALHERIRRGHGKVIGLAGIEYTVLIAIAHLAAAGDANVKMVADHLHLSGAFITSTTQDLLQLGLIHKTMDMADRRRVTLTISGKGRAALEKLAPRQRRVNDVEFGCLSREEFKALNKLMRRMIECGDRAVALQAYLSTGGDPSDRE
jgi:MarR family transcriptional regulator, organic hydroperoxide resistance regulator